MLMLVLQSDIKVKLYLNLSSTQCLDNFLVQ